MSGYDLLLEELLKLLQYFMWSTTNHNSELF